MAHNPMIGKHAHNNRESKEGQVLRYIREHRKLSLKDTAEKINLKAQDVDHFENGRRFYKASDIEMFLKIYEFEMSHFKAILEMKLLNRSTFNLYVIKHKC